MPKQAYEAYRYYLETNRSSLSRRQLAKRLEVRIRNVSVDVDPHQPTTLMISATTPRQQSICKVVGETLHPVQGGLRLVAAHSGRHYAVSNKGNQAGEVIVTLPPKPVGHVPE